MPRRKITFTKGHYYHIYNQGAYAHNLFVEDDNYQYVLRQTRRYAHRFSITVIAYVLMPNHYHFLLRQDGDVPLYELPARVFGGYSRAVNKRYGWRGTMFRGRFHAKPVRDDAYFLQLCRYIHANPVRHGFVTQPDEWRYSNYHEWLGTRRDSLVDLPLVDHYFPNRDDYADFVWKYLLYEEWVPRALVDGPDLQLPAPPPS
jgi:putative transposase